MLQALASLGQRLLKTAHADSAPSPRPDTDGPRLLSLANTPAGYGGVPELPAAQDAHPLSRYSVTPVQALLLVELLRGSRRALDPDYAQQLIPEEHAALTAFYAKRTQLLGVALRDPAIAPPPARSHAVPALEDCRNGRDILKRLLANSHGLVVGAANVGSAGKQLLIDNMDLLRKRGVDTLYLDHLQGDVHQGDLDLLQREGRLTPALARFLTDLDSIHTAHVGTPYTYRALVEAACRAGLRVVALDLAVSYHLKGAEAPDELRRQERSDIRAKVFSHVATARIQHHRRGLPVLPGQRRWVALMGSSGAGVFNGNAGVAARLGMPSLRVEEVPAGRSEKMRAGYDPGRSLPPGLTDSGGELQCDHLFKVPRQGLTAVPEPSPEPCRAPEAEMARRLRAAVAGCAEDLSRIGTYRLVEMGPGAHVLVHRSNRGHLVAQRIVPVKGGGLRLQLAQDAHAARWGHVEQVFPTLDTLRQALSTGLEEVPASAAVAGRT